MPLLWTTHRAPTERGKYLVRIGYRHFAALRLGQIWLATLRNTTLAAFIAAAIVFANFQSTLAVGLNHYSQRSENNEKVDALFSWFNKSTPGCAVSIMKAGDIVYSHAYGMANIELGVPLTIDSVFPIDSMSKQFTAMSVVLLALQGKLSFADDVHKYLPELPNYGYPISIDDLLHQTSGLKDAGELLRFAGFRSPFDVQTRKAYLDIILRQHELNFIPGDQYLYSDTNYFLLCLIVERVSGQPFAGYVRREIFEPLGMTHTQFRDDSTRLIAGRVAEYNKAYDESSADGQFHNADSHIEALGQDGVFTTVGDLAKWDRNFYDPKVGGPRAIELMLETKKLRDGGANNYALGLIRGTYRGLPKVEHGGGGFGSDTEMIRFPEQRLSVAVLCNMRDLDSHDQDIGSVPLTKKLLDIFLTDQFKPSVPATVSSSHPAANANQLPSKSADDLKRFAGLFWDGRSESVREFVVKDGKLVVNRRPDGGSIEFEYDSTNRFRRGPAMLTFDKELKEVAIAQPGAPTITLRRVSDTPAMAATLKQYAGEFYSSDVDASWSFIVAQDHLQLSLKNFDNEILQPAFADAFFSRRGLIHFVRDAKGRITGFEAMNTRVKGVRFVRGKSSP